MLSYVIRYKFSILLAILIIFLSLIPDNSMPGSALFSIPYLDKIAHFSLYGLLGFLALLESRCRERCVVFHALLILLVFTMSALIEVLQATVVKSRSAEWLDLLANISGLLVGYLVYRTVYFLNLFGIRS